ncbi:MAG: dipeptidase [Bdellovibrionales bacterium]|nr:dipeptidase [Bdellovibrionales bacterium]
MTFLLLLPGAAMGAAELGAADLSAKGLDPLMASLEKVPAEERGDFAAFLRAATPLLEEPPQGALRYLTGRRAFDPAKDAELFRLLGIHARLSGEKELIEILGKLVAIPTYRKAGVPQHQNPEILRLGRHLEQAAGDAGLGFRNVDDRIYEITLPPTDLAGETPDRIPVDRLLGIYTHADVVPANASLWVLENGTRLDPYRMSIVGDRIYGRGTEDDKCSVAAALLVMREIRKSGIRLKRGIRLIVETTEETSGEGFEHYKTKTAIPPHNVVLDSSYPLVVAEKGWGQIDFDFALGAATPAGVEIVEITGGTAVNQVPEASVAHLRADDLHALKKLVEAEAPGFAAAHPGAGGKTVKITAAIEEATLRLTLKGESAHSSSPEAGLNPLSRMLLFLTLLSDKTPFADGPWLQAAKLSAALFGADDEAKTLGVAYSDPFMGPLTAAVTYMERKEKSVRLSVNLRIPRGKELDALKKEILAKVDAYRQSTGQSFELAVETGAWMFRNPKGPWISALLETFAAVTGLPADPVSEAGSTTAKQLPNGLNFGPAMPGQVYTGHTEKEFKLKKNLLLDVQLFTEAFLRLANLEKME